MGGVFQHDQRCHCRDGLPAVSFSGRTQRRGPCWGLTCLSCSPGSVPSCRGIRLPDQGETQGGSAASGDEEGVEEIFDPKTDRHLEIRSLPASTRWAG